MSSLLLANAISLTGSVLTMVAIPWFVLVTTGSAIQTGLTAASEVLAAIVAALFVGALVDRLGAKRISVVADMTSGLSIALIPTLYYTVGLAFWELLALVFLSSFCNVPGGTARSVLTPDLAALAQMRLERANAVLQAIQRGARLLGAPLAGVLIALLAPSRLLWVDAATFGVSALLVAFFVPTSLAAGSVAHMSSNVHAPRSSGYLRDLADGARYLLHDRLIRAIVLTVMLTNFLDAPFFSVIMPVYVRDRYGQALDLGLFIAALAGGALASSLLFGAVGHRLPRRATFVGSFILMGLPYWVLALQPPLPIVLASAVFIGLAAGPLNPIIGTLAQERVPAELRGRVFGALTAGSYIAMPFGIVLAGFLVAGLGVQRILFILAACYLVVTFSLLANRALREMNAPALLEPPSHPGKGGEG